MKGVEVDSDLAKEIQEMVKDKSSEIEALPKYFKSVVWDQQVV